MRVVDGATYDGATLASSGNSVCKVNNRTFSVAPWESAPVSSGKLVALRFTPGETPVQDAVALVLLDGPTLPADSTSASYYQLGRVIFPYDAPPYVVQDHADGIPQLWWYLLCP